MEELRETIVVREGDRTVRMSKQRAMIKTVMNKSLKGDPRAILTLIRLMTRFAEPDGGATEVTRRSPSTSGSCGGCCWMMCDRSRPPLPNLATRLTMKVASHESARTSKV
jgi:hypothetical protein